jgi:hypothetical protein
MKSEDLGISPQQMRMLKKLNDDITKHIATAKRLLAHQHEMAGTLHKVIPEGKSKNVIIEHITARVTDQKLMFDNLAAAVKGRPDRVCPPGTYVRLIVKVDDVWEIMMTDAPYELHSSRPLMEHAHGRVLIAGLGLGASLLPVLRKKSVKMVVVVEKSHEVIDLVLPHVRKALTAEESKKLLVHNEDAFQWSPSCIYDCIWLDIWPRISEENLAGITKLKRRYGRWLNRKSKKAWMGAWEEGYLRKEASKSRVIERAIFGTIGGKLPMQIDLEKGIDKVKVGRRTVRL